MNDGSKIVSTTSDAFSKVMESSGKVGTLVAEISQASREQSHGIDQVNIAISEMDKVVQQNAANAEESASAAEEMNAQAEQLKEYVEELVVMVRGNKGSTHRKSGGGAVINSDVRQKHCLQLPDRACLKRKNHWMIGPRRSGRIK